MSPAFREITRRQNGHIASFARALNAAGKTYGHSKGLLSSAFSKLLHLPALPGGGAGRASGLAVF
jgi:hypothetical protein